MMRIVTLAKKDAKCIVTSVEAIGIPSRKNSLPKESYQAKRAKIGRFLLDSMIWGNGYGTKALKLLTEYIFNETPITTLELTVFNSNKSAICCYEKTGFVKTSETVRPNGWIAITMEIRRTA